MKSSKEMMKTRSAVAMTEGLIRKEEEQLKAKIDRVSRRRNVDPTMVHLALGVVRVP